LSAAPPHTPLGELTELPQTPSWILGDLLLRGGEGRQGKGRGEKGREGEGRKERGEGEGKDGEGGAVSAPKLKLAPQNYFPGAGAECRAV